VRAPAGDRARDDADAVEAGLERHAVDVAEVAGRALGHVEDLEGQQDRALGPLVDDDLAVDDLRDAGLAGVELVDGRDDLLAGVLVARAEVGAALPQLVDDRADRALGHAGSLVSASGGELPQALGGRPHLLVGRGQRERARARARRAVELPAAATTPTSASAPTVSQHGSPRCTTGTARPRSARP
jgi:hypothetical protein